MVAAEGNSVQSMLLHVGSFCGGQFCPDRRIFVSVTILADSPTLSCLPHGLAESLLTFLAADLNNEGINFDVQDSFELEVPLLDEFCLVLDCLHYFCNPGQAIHSKYSAF